MGLGNAFRVFRTGFERGADLAPHAERTRQVPFVFTLKGLLAVSIAIMAVGAAIRESQTRLWVVYVTLGLYWLVFILGAFVRPLAVFRRDLTTPVPDNTDRSNDANFPTKSAVTVTCKAIEGKVYFPKRCPCCGGKADSNYDLKWVQVSNVRFGFGGSRSWDVSRSRFLIPYCSTCRAHLHWKEQLLWPGSMIRPFAASLIIRPAGPLLLLTLIVSAAIFVGIAQTPSASGLIGDSALVATIGGIVLAITFNICIYRIVYKKIEGLAISKIERCIRKYMLKRSCCTDGYAIGYATPPGQSGECSFTIHHPSYFQEFVSGNEVLSQASQP